MENALDFQLLTAFLIGVTALLVLILIFKVNAFISLLIASIVVGLGSGMQLFKIVDIIIKGMGDTLGFVAIVVGLGAIFGEILRQSGSTEKLAASILKLFGTEKAPIALSMAGFLIAIPVFFDVAFIILVPVLYGLQTKTGKSLLYFAIPLLASLAVTHAFIPPTPGPIAVADILGAELGWVIMFGFIVGIPTTIVAGLFFGKYISNRIYVKVPVLELELEQENVSLNQLQPSVFMILCLICLPIVLILVNTVTKSIYTIDNSIILRIFQFVGHPIIALLLTTLLALYFLGSRLGYSKEQLQTTSMKALGPAGVIILITGAGGVLKQMLTETGAGKMLADQFANMHLSPLLMAFLLALIVRLIQGSATVAMITSAGIMANVMIGLDTSPMMNALLVLAIAAGASGFSHVNDSGFWLVNRYLGLSEASTLRSWTVMTGILSITAITIILILGLWV